MGKLRKKDLARQFGTNVQNIPSISEYDFRYESLSPSEQANIVAKVLRRIDSGTMSKTGSVSRWMRGWREAFEEYDRTGQLSALVPKYIRTRQALRLNGQFIMPVDAEMELNWYQVFREWLFREYFEPFDHIFEFGCGTGFNLAILAQMYPDKQLYGTDWVQSSVDILHLMEVRCDWNIKGSLFDFFTPNYDIVIPPNSAVFTIGALEQTDTRYWSFIEYLLHMKPALCVHIEPIIEWYDESNLVDYTGIRHLRERNYWSGFPAAMEKLESRGLVKIIKTKRTEFGSLFIEGYSQFIYSVI